MFKKHTHILVISFTVVFIFSSLWIFGFVKAENVDVYWKIDKSLSLFGAIFKEISRKYVDEVDPEIIVRSGIEGMLEVLDPYTVYYEDDEGDDLRIFMKGRYGGVGLSIGKRNNKITIISAMDESPASKMGIISGDVIIEIEGKSSEDMHLEQAGKLMRGEIGTTVTIKIEREGESGPLEFTIERAEIKIENVSYSGVIRDQIGYIKLTKFNREAADEVRHAIRSLNKNEIKGLILDLRDNGGGMLEAAVDICNLLLDKGALIVTTKGRLAESYKEYYSENDPIYSRSLVVLVNQGSASASEIVAGAVQDLDRGLIIGQKTFGKGLVQTVYPLHQNSAFMKITTAKYYVPSGRSIQIEDYTKKRIAKLKRYHNLQKEMESSDLAPDPDSNNVMEDKSYFTKNKRVVYGGGGIEPDIRVLPDDHNSAILVELLRMSIIFGYATHYTVTHDEFPDDFTVDMNDFKTYLNKKNFEYTSEGENKLNEFVELANNNNYDDTTLDMLNLLKGQIIEEKEKDFDRNHDIIKILLEEEILSRYYGTKRKYEYSFKRDDQLQKALFYLENEDEYLLKLVSGLEIHYDQEENENEFQKTGRN